MLEVPTKTRVTVEVNRDEYSIKFILRHRRPWGKLSPEDRKLALQQGAAALEELVDQMRAEAYDIQAEETARIAPPSPSLNLRYK